MVDLKGIDLARYLAQLMSDLEFEMLVRERIKQLFDSLMKELPNLSEAHNACIFRMSWTDNATWDINIGETYNKTAEMRGQVLSKCISDVLRLYEMKNSNKLSLLLPSPTAVTMPPSEWDEDAE
jgi:hypothetical protein